MKFKQNQCKECYKLMKIITNPMKFQQKVWCGVRWCGVVCPDCIRCTRRSGRILKQNAWTSHMQSWWKPLTTEVEWRWKKQKGWRRVESTGCALISKVGFALILFGIHWICIDLHRFEGVRVRVCLDSIGFVWISSDLCNFCVLICLNSIGFTRMCIDL